MTQRDAFRRAVTALNEAVLDDARWPETSGLIDEAFEVTGNILAFGSENPTSKVEIFFSKCYQRGVDRSDLEQEYFRTYHPIDEHLPRLRRLPDGKITPIVDLFTESELKTSPAYNEAYARFDIQKGLNVRLDGPGGSHIAWGIGNSVATDGWSSSQIRMVARMLPHIRQYVRVRSALAEARALGASVIELLDNTRMGIIQLDWGGRIVEANDRARELLRQNDGLTDEGGELRATRPEDNSRLQEHLARALPRLGGPGESSSMAVRRKSWSPGLALHVKPATVREVDYRSQSVAALVLVIDPVSPARIEPALVAAVLGLTPAEAVIAVLLAEGRTLRQIAVATGRKYSTIQTHLRHIFAKLGCSRQLEVVQAVEALSKLPSAQG
ncbi:MAG: LuxR C-terminal-related transcriptional regulator [Rhodospirillales bacterium]|nr:LuxR C-terminal-related transcriptional regulator [Rhodospirillales bacterium]